MKFAPLLCVITLACPAGAETFNVSLGGKSLGTLSYAKKGKTSTLTSILSNTPLGVFNGNFQGSSVGSLNSSTFIGTSKSSRKQRVVNVEISKGKPISTTVTPAKEQTDQSNVAQVQHGVIDPIRAISQLITAKDCPPPMRLYDGRRVVSLAPSSRQHSSTALTCDVNYQVIAGPGHLSPLRISSAKMRLSYDLTGAQQSLRQIKISSGIFSLSLTLQK